MLVGYSGEFCHAKHHSHFLQEMYILVIILTSSVQSLTRYSSCTVCHRPMKQASIVRPIEEWCAMTFISDRAYDDRTAGDKTAEKIA